MLYYAQISFAILALISIVIGMTFWWTEADPSTANNVLCLHETEWGFVSTFGLVFGTIISMLVLMQINASQYVLVRIPYNMGIFNKEICHEVNIGMRKTFLKQLTIVKDDGLNEPLIQKLKESTRTDEDYRL